jgi:hypothetical protein
VERRSPAVCKVSDHKEGKDEMTKASIDLQDLRRRIYVKAKAETSWKFRGLYVHVRAPNRQGFGWARWSRGWLYQTLKLFNGYRVVRPAPKAAPAGAVP